LIRFASARQNTASVPGISVLRVQTSHQPSVASFDVFGQLSSDQNLHYFSESTKKEADA